MNSLLAVKIFERNRANNCSVVYSRRKLVVRCSVSLVPLVERRYKNFSSRHFHVCSDAHQRNCMFFFSIPLARTSKRSKMHIELFVSDVGKRIPNKECHSHYRGLNIGRRAIRMRNSFVSLSVSIYLMQKLLFHVAV